jgi:hypothetical protein
MHFDELHKPEILESIASEYLIGQIGDKSSGPEEAEAAPEEVRARWIAPAPRPAPASASASAAALASASALASALALCLL